MPGVLGAHGDDDDDPGAPDASGDLRCEPRVGMRDSHPDAPVGALPPVERRNLSSLDEVGEAPSLGLEKMAERPLFMPRSRLPVDDAE